MKFKAALFDMNGVIVDDEKLHETAFTKVLQDRGYNFTHGLYMKHFAGKTDSYGFRSFFSSVDSEIPEISVISREKAAAYMELATSLKPYRGIINYIHALNNEGYRLALVTSSTQIEADAVLSAFNIASLFEHVITANQISKSKPDPQGYLMAAEALHLEPSDCFVIEDAPSGVTAAISAGMRCIAVTNTHTTDQLKEATLVVDFLSSNSVTP